MLTAAYTSFIPSECVKYILNREPVLYLANFSFFSEGISCFTGSSNTDMARQDTFKWYVSIDIFFITCKLEIHIQ